MLRFGDSVETWRIGNRPCAGWGSVLSGLRPGPATGTPGRSVRSGNGSRAGGPSPAPSLPTGAARCPRSARRWLIASRLSSPVASIAFTALHISTTWRRAGRSATLFEHIFLQPAGVEVGQAFIDADGKQMRQGEHLVPFDIAEMLGARHPADDRGMGPRCAPQVQHQAHRHARDHAHLHPGQQRGTDGRRMGGKVRLGIGPQAARAS
jgi:hypothetical protein